MARRQQTSNKTKATKAASKSIVRRHSKRLQKQQRDLPPLLQDLTCVTRDQASGEEDSPSVLIKSGSDISLQDASSKVEYQPSESSCCSEDMISVIQPQMLPTTGCHGPVGGCQASMPVMPWLSEAPISNETIIAYTDFTTTSEIAKRRIQSKRIKRQRQNRSGSVVSSVSSSRSSIASPDISTGTAGLAVGEVVPMACGDVVGASSIASCCHATTTTGNMAISSAGSSVVVPSVAGKHQEGTTMSHPLEVPIPTYIASQQQSAITNGYNSHSCLVHPMLSHLQQELSYRFVKDQTMAAAAAGSTASSSAAGSCTAKIPASELGSSLGSAFQKKTKLPLSEEADQFMERKNYSHNLDFTLFKEIIDAKVVTKWCNAHVSIARFIQNHRKQQQQAPAAPSTAAQENHKMTELVHCNNPATLNTVPSSGVVCYQHPLATSSAVSGAAGLLWQQQQQQLQLWQQQQQQQQSQQQGPPQLVPISSSQYQFLQSVPMHMEAPSHNSSTNSASLSVPMGSLLLPQGIIQVPSVLPSTAVLQGQANASMLPAAAHPYQLMSSQQLPQLQQLSSGSTSAAVGTFLVNNNHSLIAPFQPAFVSSWVK